MFLGLFGGLRSRSHFGMTDFVGGGGFLCFDLEGIVRIGGELLDQSE